MLNFINSKEYNIRLIGFEICFTLMLRFGNQFLINIQELILLLLKLIKREDTMKYGKEMILTIIMNIYIATGGPRSYENVSIDILKIIAKTSTDRAGSVRKMTATCIAAVITYTYRSLIIICIIYHLLYINLFLLFYIYVFIIYMYLSFLLYLFLDCPKFYRCT
jgi:hypothetical protein